MGRATPKAAQRPARSAAPRVRLQKKRAKRHHETTAERRARAARILATLRTLHAEANCALHHRSALELLVATILSAQCTDVRVNQVTPALFRRFSTAAAFARADAAELEAAIRSTGFFRNKARNLIGMGQRLVQEFGGEVPASMPALLTLPGVARKTANCVLGTWFKQQEGVVVDTHVGRLAQRLGLLTDAKNDKDAVTIEQELMQLFPRDSWTFLSHALIEHGRGVCNARKPQCAACALASECPSAGQFNAIKRA